MRGRLVSVVMAAFDEEVFIEEALESVLAQTYAPIEVIVVDDGSSDRTVDLARARGVTVLRQPHEGPAAARNAGLKVSRGEYWTIFDADDVMPPRRIEYQVAHLEQHPEHGIVLGLTEAFVTPGQPRPRHYNPAWDEGPFPACAGTMMARRDILAAVGPYDESIWMSYDVEWLARVKDAGIAAGHVDELTLRYRIHGGNSTADRPAVHGAMLRLLHESVRRRRTPGG